jgi:hypothetical protein
LSVESWRRQRRYIDWALEVRWAWAGTASTF